MKTIILTITIITSLNLRAGDTTGTYQLIKDAGIKCPKIVYAQMMFESGYLDCTDCSWSNSNNPFGFFWKGKYIRFCHIEDAIRYYKWWQGELYKGGNYYTFLDRIGYATDPNYIKNLKQVYKSIFK